MDKQSVEDLIKAADAAYERLIEVSAEVSHDPSHIRVRLAQAAFNEAQRRLYEAQSSQD